MLKAHHLALYSSLLLTEKRYPHLLEIDEAANERMKVAGVTEKWKAVDSIKLSGW